MRAVTKTLMISALFIFLFSHLILLNALGSIYAIKYCKQTYGDVYRLHPSGTIDLVFDNSVPIPLEPAYHRYGTSTLCGSTFFMIARLTNGSNAIVLLEVNFNEEFKEIINYSIHSLPLNGEAYAGLASNGSHFWTLEYGQEADISYSAHFHHLICFSLEKRIISNRTLDFPDPSIIPLGPGEFVRGGLQIRDNTLILLEVFGFDSGNIDCFANITTYDLLTLERGNSFDAYYSFPISTKDSHYYFPWSINLDETGRLWIEHYSFPPPSIPFSSWNPSIGSLAFGYSLDSHTADKTLFEDYYHTKPLSDDYFSSNYISYQNWTNRDLSRLLYERTITQNKVINCYQVYEWNSGMKLMGFRISNIQQYSFSFPIFHLTIWGVSILLLIAIIAFVLYTYYRKDPLVQSVSFFHLSNLNKADEPVAQKLRSNKQRFYQSIHLQLLQRYRLGLLFFISISLLSLLFFLLSLAIPLPQMTSFHIHLLADMLSMVGLSGLVIGVYLFSKKRITSLSSKGRESVIFLIIYFLGSFLIAFFCLLVIDPPVLNLSQADLFLDLYNIRTTLIFFHLLDITIQTLLLFVVLRFTTCINEISFYSKNNETYSLIGVPILGILASWLKIIDLSYPLSKLSSNAIIENLELYSMSFYPHVYFLFPLLILSLQIWSGYKIYCVLNQLEAEVSKQDS